jgi:hypothetical protein
MTAKWDFNAFRIDDHPTDTNCFTCGLPFNMAITGQPISHTCTVNYTKIQLCDKCFPEVDFKLQKALQQAILDIEFIMEAKCEE